MFTKSWLAVFLVVILFPAVSWGVITNGGFETGDFTGWSVEGDAWSVNDEPGADHNQGAGFEGDYYAESYSLAGETATGTITSDPFALSEEQSILTFLIAGWDGPPDDPRGVSYVQVILESDDSVIGGPIVPPNQNEMAEREIDLSDYVGETVYIEVVDGDDEGGFAWLAVDAFTLVSAEPEIFEVSSFAELVDALEDARAGDEIRVEAGTIDWVVANPGARTQYNVEDITLSGGWNSDFSDRTPGATVITGFVPEEGDEQPRMMDGGGDSVVLDGFTIQGNTARAMFDAGAGTQLTLRNNVISGNSFVRQFIYSGSVILENNIIADTGTATGGFIEAWAGDLIADANIFYQAYNDNADDREWSLIELGSEGNLEEDLFLTNNVFVGNWAPALADNYDELVFSNNLLWNNNWDAYSDEEVAGVGTDILVEDPLFADPAALDFRVAFTSPSIGAGTEGQNLGADLDGYTGVLEAEDPGSLSVILGPQGAVDAGAQWSIDGGQTWYNSGDQIDDLAPGTYTVVFRAPAGWTAPGPQQVTVSSGDVAMVPADQATFGDASLMPTAGLWALLLAMAALLLLTPMALRRNPKA